MKKYRILVNGENILMETCGRKGRYGLYAMRQVEAESLEEAEETALEEVRCDPGLKKEVLNGKADPPRFFIFGAEELDTAEELSNTSGDLSFYPEEGVMNPCCGRGGSAQARCGRGSDGAAGKRFPRPRG